MKKIVFPLMLILVVGLTYMQSAETQVEDKIIWAESTQLEWNDFQGTPKETSGLDANTIAGIQCKPTKTKYKIGERVNYDVFAYFSKSNSWVKSGKQSEYLLKHEQIHFDIAELHARKLKTYIQQTKITVENTRLVNDYLDEISVQLKAMQDQYDKETQRGEDKIAQYNWAKFVLGELGRLNQLP